MRRRIAKQQYNWSSLLIEGPTLSLSQLTVKLTRDRIGRMRNLANDRQLPGQSQLPVRKLNQFMTKQHVAAVDLGASSGRVMDVSFDGRSIALQDVHRFPNIPVQTPQRLHWDVLRLWQEITIGIAKVSDAASIGVDCWGVDYALLDSAGELLANPVHYRDPRTNGAMEWAFERMPRREIFDRTGIQFLQFNGLFQLAASIRDGSPLLENATTLLTIADLFNYWLTGSKTCEYTEATTLQLCNAHTADWDRDIAAAMGIPDILAPIVRPGLQNRQIPGHGCHCAGVPRYR